MVSGLYPDGELVEAAELGAVACDRVRIWLRRPNAALVEARLEVEGEAPVVPAAKGAMMLDTSTEQGNRAAQRLQEEPVIWLTTVNASGQPQSSPVWFVWDDQGFLIYSRPGQKIRNIRRHPQVSLHLNDNDGGDVVSIEGIAGLVTDAGAAAKNRAMIEKYQQRIKGIGMDPESFAAAYTEAIRVTPTRMRVW